MLQEKRQRKDRKIQRQKRITMIDIYLCEDQAEQLRCLEKWITRYIEQNGWGGSSNRSVRRRKKKETRS